MGCTHAMKAADTKKLSLGPTHVILVGEDYRPMLGYKGVALLQLDTIIVKAYWYKEKLVISEPEVLGHEYWHLLAYKYPELIWNPDELR